jgi:4-hydroxythreonine-4-phosphate dehydrogenase
MKRIALTVGDPAGIGPEIVLRALASPERPVARYVVYGPRAAVDERVERFGLRPLADLDVVVEDIALETPSPGAARRRPAALPPPRPSCARRGTPWPGGWTRS